MEFLAQAIRMFPDAKRTLLTAYADTDAAIRAINEAKIHHYLLKPWDPPEQNLYPVLDDLLEDWQAGISSASSGIARVGRALVAADRMSCASFWPGIRSRSGGSTSKGPMAIPRCGPLYGRWAATRQTSCHPVPGRGAVAGTLRTPNLRNESDCGCVRGHEFLRRRDHWRRASRIGRGRLRCLRRLENRHGGAGCAGRTGRAQFAHRKLSRISFRDQRIGSGAARRDAGSSVRGRDRMPASWRRIARGRAVSACKTRRRFRTCLSRGIGGDGRGMAQAQRSRGGSPAGCRSVLRGGKHGSDDLRGRGRLHHWRSKFSRDRLP